MGIKRIRLFLRCEISREEAGIQLDKANGKLTVGVDTRIKLESKREGKRERGDRDVCVWGGGGEGPIDMYVSVCTSSMFLCG